MAETLSPTAHLTDVQNAAQWAEQNYPKSRLNIWDEASGSLELHVHVDEYPLASINFVFHDFKPTVMYIFLFLSSKAICMSWKAAPPIFQPLITGPKASVSTAPFRSKAKSSRAVLALPKIAEIYRNIRDRCFPVVNIEDMHTYSGYDEAKRFSINTCDATELVTDYASAQAVEKKLEATQYFNGVIARFGTLEVTKYWDFERRDKSPFGQDWYEQGFKEIRLHLAIARPGSRMKQLTWEEKVLRIEVSVYGKPNQKEAAKRSGWGSYYYQSKKSVYNAKTAPMTWPGPVLLAASLDPEVRARASELCAEAYARFIKALLPAPPEIEDMHTLSGYDEALIARFEKTVDDSEPFSMWNNTDKYVPVASEEDKELLYGVDESVTPFLEVGEILESLTRTHREA
jgi:hypothetical protein